jgi:hypothetical protein
LIENSTFGDGAATEIMNHPQDLCAVAERVMWFESAEEALQYPKRFLAYLMTYGTLEEILVARKYFPQEEFEAVLAEPPPGIFDPCSWSYWNLIYKRDPASPLPQRIIPAKS